VSEAGVTHRLAAILAADAVGYSRLMAADELGTLARLDAARGVFRAGVEGHRGRVVDMAGDSVLAVFETATGAVTAAAEIQRALQARGAGAPPDGHLSFRIGIHLGDVIAKPDGTVYGDGVNVAARLQGLAPEGGVAVSDVVHGAVRDRVAMTFRDHGEHAVKNIARAIRVFLLVDAPAAIAELRRRKPDFSCRYAEQHLFYVASREQLDHYVDGLRKAGVPD
jgi:adenylate cyclase